MGQEHLEKELEDERERNKDDITHLELLEKHYKEREKAYEVWMCVALPTSMLMYPIFSGSESSSRGSGEGQRGTREAVREP